MRRPQPTPGVHPRSPTLGLSLASSPAAPGSLRPRRGASLLSPRKLRGKAQLQKRRWEGGRVRGAGATECPRRVTLACKGLVCSAGSRGGFDLGEKRCGVVVGFFSIGHTHSAGGWGPGVLGDAPHKNTPPTSLGSQICSKEKKQKSFSRTLPTCPGTAVPQPGVSGALKLQSSPHSRGGVCPSVAGVRCFTPLPQRLL